MKPGDWVVTIENPFQLGRVRKVYTGSSIDPAELIDVVLYDPANGERIGRASPVEGGPSGFEPACTASSWQRIQPPTFPMRRCKSIGELYGSYRPYLQRA